MCSFCATLYIVIAAFCVVWQVGINDAEESVASTYEAEGGGKKLFLNVGGPVTPDCVTSHHITSEACCSPL